MLKHLFLFLFLLTVGGHKIFACQCNYEGSFLKMGERTPLVALVKIKKHLSFKNINNVKTAMSMEVELIELYKGSETRKAITVWGDIGNLCRPYLSTFTEGKYYVIAFDKGRDHGAHPQEKSTDYSIRNCGCFWLKVDNEKKIAIGDLGVGENSQSVIDLRELKATFKKKRKG